MGSPLEQLDPERRQELLHELNYLNMGELRELCRRYRIPATICVAGAGRVLRRTGDPDRKAVVLERVRTFLATGEVPGPTIIPATATSDTPLPAMPSPDDRLHYGQYDKRHAGLMNVLGDLTAARFRNGAVARLLCQDYWARGEAPTLAEFANAWLAADARGLGVERGEHPEAAYLTDRAGGSAGPDWKPRRARVAARTLSTLDEIAPG
jgi:hypothetical protein